MATADGWVQAGSQIFGVQHRGPIQYKDTVLPV